MHACLHLPLSLTNRPKSIVTALCANTRQHNDRMRASAYSLAPAFISAIDLRLAFIHRRRHLLPLCAHTQIEKCAVFGSTTINRPISQSANQATAQCSIKRKHTRSGCCCCCCPTLRLSSNQGIESSSSSLGQPIGEHTFPSHPAMVSLVASLLHCARVRHKKATLKLNRKSAAPDINRCQLH